MSDAVTISATSPHTTDLARALKEYAVLYERWSITRDEAQRLDEEAKRKYSEAEKLKPEVDELKAKLRGLVE